MVLRVHDCEELEVELDELGAAFENAPVLIIDKIKELTITSFDVGRSGSGDDNNEETFSSIYIKDSKIVSLPSDSLIFEDKADVLFKKVSLKVGEQLQVEVENTVSTPQGGGRVENQKMVTVLGN